MTHLTHIPGPADSPSANGATEAASGREASTRQQQAVCQGSGVRKGVGAAGQADVDQERAQDLLGYVAAGLTIQEIAEETEQSYDATRAKLSRIGAKAVSENELDHRGIANRITPTKAVEYLCDVIDMLAEPDPDVDREIENLPASLTRMERRFLGKLRDHQGRLVTKDRLYSALYFDAYGGNDADPKIIDAYVHRVRKKLPSNWRVVTEWGLGYRLEIDDGGVTTEPRVGRSALEAIAENTAADRGMTLKAIHERTHAWPVSWPRQDAMRIQREQLGASYPQIARYWGMDHTGALYGVRRSRARRDSREAAG